MIEKWTWKRPTMRWANAPPSGWRDSVCCWLVDSWCLYAAVKHISHHIYCQLAVTMLNEPRQSHGEPCMAPLHPKMCGPWDLERFDISSSNIKQSHVIFLVKGLIFYWNINSLTHCGQIMQKPMTPPPVLLEVSISQAVLLDYRYNRVLWEQKHSGLLQNLCLRWEKERGHREEVLMLSPCFIY